MKTYIVDMQKKVNDRHKQIIMNLNTSIQSFVYCSFVTVIGFGYDELYAITASYSSDFKV